MSNMNAYIEAAMIQCPRCGASTGSKCWVWRCKNGYKGCNFRVCAYKAELPEPHLERAVAARKTALHEVASLRDELEATRNHAAQAVHDRDDAWRERDEAEATISRVREVADRMEPHARNMQAIGEIEVSVPLLAAVDSIRAALNEGGETNGE